MSSTFRVILINVQGDPQCCSLGENVAALALELRGERRALVVVQATAADKGSKKKKEKN